MAVRQRGPRGPAIAAQPAGQDAPDAREKILRTAYTLFNQHGINVVGVDWIVADAGVAKTTLYRHFHSKEDLVVAVIDRHQALFTWEWLEQEIAHRASTPEASILAIFDAFDDWFHEESYGGCLFINSLLETRAKSGPARQAAVLKLETIRGIVLRFTEAMNVEDAEALAAQIQTLMAGSVIFAVGGELDAAKRARVVTELLLTNVTRRPEQPAANARQRVGRGQPQERGFVAEHTNLDANQDS